MARRNRHPGIRRETTTTGETRWKATAEVGERGQRQQLSKRFATQQAAVDWRNDVLARRRRGEVVQASQQSLGSWFDEWLAVRSLRVRPASAAAYMDAWQRVSDQLGAVPLSRVTPSLIERTYATLARRYQPSTIRAVHRVLKMLFEDAVRDGLLARSPMGSVTPPETKRRAPTAWTLSEAQQFIASLGDSQTDLLWYFLLETWLRSGEVRALRWSDVDLEKRLIHVRRTVTLDPDGTRTVGPPKSRTSIRAVTMSAELVERLRLYKERRPRSMERDPLIFNRPGGGMWHPARLGVLLTEACSHAGVAVLTVHGLRHTGGSIAHANGVPMAVISERMGHASPHITWAIYTHADRDQMDSVADTMASALAPIDTSRVRLASTAT